LHQSAGGGKKYTLATSVSRSFLLPAAFFGRLDRGGIFPILLKNVP
jgi:hypothetical protein